MPLLGGVLGVRMGIKERSVV